MTEHSCSFMAKSQQEKRSKRAHSSVWGHICRAQVTGSSYTKKYEEKPEILRSLLINHRRQTCIHSVQLAVAQHSVEPSSESTPGFLHWQRRTQKHKLSEGASYAEHDSMLRCCTKIFHEIMISRGWVTRLLLASDRCSTSLLHPSSLNVRCFCSSIWTAETSYI